MGRQIRIEAGRQRIPCRLEERKRWDIEADRPHTRSTRQVVQRMGLGRRRRMGRRIQMVGPTVPPRKMEPERRRMGSRRRQPGLGRCRWHQPQ